MGSKVVWHEMFKDEFEAAVAARPVWPPNSYGRPPASRRRSVFRVPRRNKSGAGCWGSATPGFRAVQEKVSRRT